MANRAERSKVDIERSGESVFAEQTLDVSAIV